jgi:hypothetical protein
MITRRHHASVLLLAALTAALHAASGIPPAAEPKGAAPVTSATAATKAPDLPPASIPAAKPAPDLPPASIPASKPAPAPSLPTTTPPAAPATREPVSTPAAVSTSAPASANPPSSPEKPGVLSAAKSTSPPPSPKGTATASLPPRFRQIRERISALFDTRTTPPAPPDPRTNPFRPAGAVSSAPLPVAEGAAPASVAVNMDLTTLQQAVATLKVRGVVQIGSRMQLVITSAGKEGTYKEGDIINVLLPPGDPVHLRVRQVSRYSVTLSLNDAELTLKF